MGLSRQSVVIVMAVTISKDNISSYVGQYIRDVLRNNLTDTQSPARESSSWILRKYERQARIIGKLPKVYITNVVVNRERINIDRLYAKEKQILLTVNIEVFSSGSSASSDVDAISDEIIKVLKNPSSTDGTKTIAEQNLVYIESSVEDDDDVISAGQGIDVIAYIKRVEVVFEYVGN